MLPTTARAATPKGRSPVVTNKTALAGGFPGRPPFGEDLALSRGVPFGPLAVALDEVGMVGDQSPQRPEPFASPRPSGAGNGLAKEGGPAGG